MVRTDPSILFQSIVTRGRSSSCMGRGTQLHLKTSALQLFKTNQLHYSTLAEAGTFISLIKLNKDKFLSKKAAVPIKFYLRPLDHCKYLLSISIRSKIFNCSCHFSNFLAAASAVQELPLILLCPLCYYRHV